MISTITVGGSSVNLVAMPTSPGPRSIELGISDAVGRVTSEFTGQVQAQQWPGADLLTGTFTLPSLTRKQAGPWIAFLMQLRGISNAFMLGDPLNAQPLGTPSGSPVALAGNAAMSQQLTTSGWTASTVGLLLPGDWIQIGYRLHRNLDVVTSDGSGNATLNIWPSVRETLTSNVGIVTSNTQGLFRLASNMRKISFDVTTLTRMSFPFQEYR